MGVSRWLLQSCLLLPDVSLSFRPVLHKSTMFGLFDPSLIDTISLRQFRVVTHADNAGRTVEYWVILESCKLVSEDIEFIEKFGPESLQMGNRLEWAAGTCLVNRRPGES